MRIESLWDECIVCGQTFELDEDLYVCPHDVAGEPCRGACEIGERIRQILRDELRSAAA